MTYLRKYFAFALLCIFFGVSFGLLPSCSSDDPIADIGENLPVFSGSTENTSDMIEIIDSGKVSWHEHYSTMLSEAQQGNGEEDEMLAEFAQMMLASMDSLTDVYIEQAGSNFDPNLDGPDGKNRLLGYQYYNIRYTSVNEDNQPIRLSELVAWPYNNILANPNPDNVVIGCHVTITANKERPSNYYNNDFGTDVGMLLCHAKSNGVLADTESLVVIPDYEGYGSSSVVAHPYLYQSLTARQVVDGVKAAINWFQGKGKGEWGGKLDKGWKSYSVGYSQGGSVAMAVHKHIEQNNLADQLNYIGSICGDGPYDPVATFKEYISTGKVYMPVAVGLILKGMCDSNPYMKGKYTPSDYFTDAFMATNITTYIAQKEKTTDEIQKELLNYSMYNESDFYMMARDKTGNYYKYKPESDRSWDEDKIKEPMGAYCEIEQLIRPEVIQYFKGEGVSDEYLPKCEALYKALEMNIITRDWTPSKPNIVFHSTRDEVVPFVNYESVYDVNNNNNKFYGFKYQSKKTYTHVGAGKSFYMLYESGYARALLKDKLSDYSRENQVGGSLW